MTTPTVLFVGGFGRSGSTLLELLLAQHDDIAAVGEVVHAWERGLAADERCGCGTAFSRCPFWAEVGVRAFGGWQEVDYRSVARLRARVDRTRHVPWLTRPRLPRSRRADVAAYTDLYIRLYRAAANLDGGGQRVVVDSSKHVSLAFALSRASLDLRVVHLVRDAPAVAYSWTRKVPRPEVVGRQDFMPVLSPTRAAARWVVQNAGFDLLARSVPTMRLRYEDLVAAPEVALASVRHFAGLPDRTAISAPSLTHGIAGNPLRFRRGPLTVRSDDRWRAAFPARDRFVVAALTWPLRARYGYLRSGS